MIRIPKPKHQSPRAQFIEHYTQTVAAALDAGNVTTPERMQGLRYFGVVAAELLRLELAPGECGYLVGKPELLEVTPEQYENVPGLLSAAVHLELSTSALAGNAEAIRAMTGCPVPDDPVVHEAIEGQLKRTVRNSKRDFRRLRHKKRAAA